MTTNQATRRGRHARPSRRRGAGTHLHLRARGVAMFVGGLAVVTLLGWAGADYLVHREWSGGAVDRIPVVVAAPLLGVILASTGLGGADEELERSTPARWRWIRLGHVALTALPVSAAVALTGLWEPQTYGAFELVRNTAGFAGLVAASATVLGSRLAWVPPFVYAAVVYIVAPQPLSTDTAWWTWPVQPWSAAPAAWAAGTLLVAGTAAYVVHGARPTRTGDLP